MLKNISLLISKQLVILVVLATLFSLYYPQVGSNLVKTSWVVYILGIIMFGMGLNVKASDFKELFIRPKFVLIGIGAQFIIMPLIAYILVKGFNLPLGLAIGVVLVGTCPGGTSSNVITYLSKGDVALSVGITSCTTLLAPFMTPILTKLLIGQSIDVNVIAMFLSVVKVVIVPIVLGILAHRFLPKIAGLLKDVLPMISTLGIVAIVIAVVSVSAEKIIANLGIIVLIIVCHNLFGYLFGFLVGKSVTKDMAKVKALSVEVGMQNSGLATSLALTHFATQPLAAVPGALFSVWHNISGGILASIYARIK
ncbi:bile acid:sodium symporter family protein [Campylobacter ureolyticus]|uniref:bile acid:sodium symporter family protein n=1 Tax=Campylobacter ureolyticus TaxID=827 RepID=UPI0022B52F18|nr:bile acid:sodium symporter family protein [Campylobacter ureolyticus]MCZ6156352.1 bile acid:sodium symporter family protein [Campylobacter ureolyticus]